MLADIPGPGQRITARRYFKIHIVNLLLGNLQSVTGNEINC